MARIVRMKSRTKRILIGWSWGSLWFCHSTRAKLPSTSASKQISPLTTPMAWARSQVNLAPPPSSLTKEYLTRKVVIILETPFIVLMEWRQVSVSPLHIWGMTTSTWRRSRCRLIFRILRTSCSTFIMSR
jgi:hypothetical protein